MLTPMNKLRYIMIVLLCACTPKSDPPPLIKGLDTDPQTQKFLQTVLKNNQSVNLDAAMKARGYYNAKINRDAQTIDIKPGGITTISSITVSPSKYKPLLTGIAKGDPLDADKVIAAQTALYKTIEKDSCAFNLDVSHGVVLNANDTASLTYYVTEGPQAKLGSAIFTGAKTVDQKYIKQRAKWEEGACYKRAAIRQARKNLLGTGLFSAVDAKTSANQDVEFTLTEAKHRTVRAGLSVYTDEGPGITLGWEHRNYFGQGEKLEAEFTANLLEQQLETTLTKPYYYREDQTLSLNASIGREDTDAFESLALGLGFDINRTINPRLTASAGADIELTRIDDEDEEETENFILLSPHAAVNYDSRDDTLDPAKGWLLNASLAPSIDLLGESDPYFTTDLRGQTYYKAHERLTFATRLRLGSILGASTDSLPATERFFTGGGSSVRGFGFQEVGPVDEDGDPEGGRSLIEGAVELRVKATKKLGFVTFLDYGQVDDTIVPNVDDLSFGAGAGVRYFTDFGPLRFDVGVPLNNDENVDDNVQIYISIGQAF